jgi:membrane-bound ClpP family serine protease
MSVAKVKRALKDWLLVLVFMLDEVAAAVIILLILWSLDIEISPPIIVAIAVAMGGLIFLTHKKIIPAFHRKKVTGPDAMIGLCCEVVMPLEPEGVVSVAGEYWKARSVEGHINSGSVVEILAVKKLLLEVRRSEDYEIAAGN